MFEEIYKFVCSGSFTDDLFHHSQPIEGIGSDFSE